MSELDFAFVFRRHQSDGLLGGQPQLRANLRGSQSPQRHTAKSSLEEDLKKLITLDSPPPTTSEEKVLRNIVAYTGISNLMFLLLLQLIKK